MKRMQSFVNGLRDLCDRAAKIPRLIFRRLPARNLIVGPPLHVQRQAAPFQDLQLDAGGTSPFDRDLRLRKMENQSERDAQLAFALPFAPILASRKGRASPVRDNRGADAADQAVPVDLNVTSTTLQLSLSTSSGDSVLPALSPADSLSSVLSETGGPLPSEEAPATITAVPLADITATILAHENRVSLGIAGGRYVDMLSIV